MLDAPGTDDFDLPPGAAEGKVKAIDAVADPDLLEQALWIRRELRRLVEVLGDLVEEVGLGAHSLIVSGSGSRIPDPGGTLNGICRLLKRFARRGCGA